MPSPERVASRYMIASDYLSVGALIYYGKYKNHTGRIVGFGKDKWGNPTMEIEPVPKGRKQNKVMSVFKVWRKDIVDQAKAEKARLEQEAARAKLAGFDDEDDDDEDEP
jgi:hypothetical protein